MLEIIQKIAAAHSLLASMQIKLVDGQESPSQFVTLSRMAATLESIGGTMRRDLADLASELRIEQDVDDLIASTALREDDEG